MKDLKLILILILCAGLLVSLFFNVDDREIIQSLKLEKEREQEAFKHVEDSLVKVTHRNDERLLKLMREDAEKDMIVREAVAEAKEYKKRYENIKYVRYSSDSARNAALSAALGR